MRDLVSIFEQNERGGFGLHANDDARIRRGKARFEDEDSVTGDAEFMEVEAPTLTVESAELGEQSDDADELGMVFGGK